MFVEFIASIAGRIDITQERAREKGWQGEGMKGHEGRGVVAPAAKPQATVRAARCLQLGGQRSRMFAHTHRLRFGLVVLRRSSVPLLGPPQEKVYKSRLD
jgi:hypothetical protein